MTCTKCNQTQMINSNRETIGTFWKIEVREVIFELGRSFANTLSTHSFLHVY